MIIENLTTLKINQLTKAQYEAALAAGTVNENELYMTEEANVDLTDFANHTLITIPNGRMRGDVDGDGKITQEDINLIASGTGSVDVNYYDLNLTTQFPDGDIPEDYLAANVNGDGFINFTDLNTLTNPSFKAGAYTEITGNWTNNPNYATEEGQFYTDIPITGMTANHSASVIVKGTFENGFFPKAECVEGAIRIYAKLCPISALTAVASWGTGDGTAVITTESIDMGISTVSIVLAVSDWDTTSNTQSVPVTGVSSNELNQLITPNPSKNSQSAYYDAGIKCTDQAYNSLTFTADTIPTEDLTVYVVIQNL